MTGTALPPPSDVDAASLSSSACELCGAGGRTRIYPSLGIARCRSCGFASLVDKPPAAELQELYSSETGYEEYVDVQKTDTLEQRYGEALASIAELLADRAGRPVLFDVGAGAGAFLARAASRGFEVLGNEISAPARQMCERRHGFRLSEFGIEQEPGHDRFDVVTMWCVLAHVSHARETLQAVLRLLRPGGVLYFHTPRWCAIDSFGMALSRLSGGRLTRVTRRRISTAHMRLYNTANLRRLLTSVGFEVVTVNPKTAFSLQTTEYLRALAVPRRLRPPVARVLDVFIDHGVFPRNILDVFVRKPLVDAAPRPAHELVEAASSRPAVR